MKYSLLVFAAVVSFGHAQPSPSDAPATDQRVLDMTLSEYEATLGALREASQHPRVEALNRQINQLIERRDKLLFEMAEEEHPSLKTKIDRVKRERGKSQNPGKPENPEPGAGG